MKNQVVVAGKKGCKLCDAAKQKLGMMEIPYRFVDMEAFPDDWREIDLTEPMALYNLHDTLPWLRIDGKWMGYPEAMKAIRLRQEARAQERRAYERPAVERLAVA